MTNRVVSAAGDLSDVEHDRTYDRGNQPTWQTVNTLKYRTGMHWKQTF